MGVESVTPKPGPSTESPPSVGVSPSVEQVTADVAAALQEKEAALAKLLEEQKKKGEISAASESTMQALYEQIKALNENMKLLEKISTAQNLAPLKLNRKWWEDLLPW